MAKFHALNYPFVVTVKFPYSYFILGVKILLFAWLYMLLILWLAYTGDTHPLSWAQVWAELKKNILLLPAGNFFYYSLPWVLAGIIGSSVWDFIQKRKKHLPARAFSQLSFYEHDLLLKTPNNAGNVVCSYKDTLFTLNVQPKLLSLKNITIPFIRKATLIFQTQDETYAIAHYTGFAGLRRLISAAKKCRSCAIHTQTEENPSAKDTLYAAFLEKQLNNYRKYGLMLEYMPDWRTDLLLSTLLYALLGIIPLCMYGGFVVSKSSILQKGPWVIHCLPLFGVIFLLAGFWTFKKWLTERGADKQLKKLTTKQKRTAACAK